MKNKWICIFFLLSTSVFAQPRLTIITSVFNGDKFIAHFLKEIARQTIYSDCQHIIINANSPGREDKVIREFIKNHPNVEYYRLDKDPGLYGVWNMAIKLAQSDFLTNANLDDRLAPFAYETLLNQIQIDDDIDLVYSDAYITKIPNQTYELHTVDAIYKAPEYSLARLKQECFIGSHPVWRKTMHERCGLFNEKFLCAGDWEMWLRAACSGSIFKHVKVFSSVNYNGARNLSNRYELTEQRQWEQNYIKNHYPN